VKDKRTDFAVNLRRLLVWHDLTNRDLARLIGASENSVSGWLTGARLPGGKYLIEIGRLFDVSTAKMTNDPRVFGPMISDPTRYEVAEENIARARRDRLHVV
jgi:transcriptional regulator with XRE-family HTH domain